MHKKYNLVKINKKSMFSLLLKVIGPSFIFFTLNKRRKKKKNEKIIDQ